MNRKNRQNSSWDNFEASSNYDKGATERYAQRRRANTGRRYTYVNPFENVPLDRGSQTDQSTQQSNHVQNSEQNPQSYQSYQRQQNSRYCQYSRDNQLYQRRQYDQQEFNVDKKHSIYQDKYRAAGDDVRYYGQASTTNVEEEPKQSSGQTSRKTRNNDINIKGENQDNKHRNSIILRVTIVMLILALVLAIFACVINCSGSGGSNGSGGSPAVISNPSENIVMTLHGDRNTQVLKGEKYLEAGAYAIDTKAGTNVTNSIETSGSVDTSKAGDYSVSYVATDAEGKKYSQTRNVKVVDKMDADTDGISVMMYHYIYDDANPPASLNNNYLSASKFESQLKWLKENSYYYPSYQELRAYVQGTHSLPKKSVILTFDDGEEGFLAIGGNLLKKYEIPATSFIIGNLPQTPANLIKFANPYIDYQSHTFGLHDHGVSGKGKGGKIYDLNMDQQVEDFNKCKEIIGASDALAYPFGDYSEVSAEACEKAGILCAFTVNYNQVKKGDNPEILSRMRVIGTSSLDSFAYQVENGVG